MARWFASLLIVVLAAPSAALAKGDDGDVAEIRQFRLSMQKVNALVAVYEAVGAEQQNDPKQRALKARRAELESLRGKEEWTDADERRIEQLEREVEEAEEAQDAELGFMEGDASLSDMARRIERSPVVSRAVRSAGLTPREFAVAHAAFFQASMAHGFQKAGALKQLPKEVSPENVRFVAQHEAEINAISARLKASGGR